MRLAIGSPYTTLIMVDQGSSSATGTQVFRTHLLKVLFINNKMRLDGVLVIRIMRRKKRLFRYNIVQMLRKKHEGVLYADHTKTHGNADFNGLAASLQAKELTN